MRKQKIILYFLSFLLVLLVSVAKTQQDNPYTKELKTSVVALQLVAPAPQLQIY